MKTVKRERISVLTTSYGRQVQVVEGTLTITKTAKGEILPYILSLDKDDCFSEAILAIPGDFSEKHITAIVKKKIKEGDIVLIECEGEIEHSTNGYSQVRFIPDTITKRTPITIHPSKEKRYTHQEVKKLLRERTDLIRRRALGFGASVCLNDWINETLGDE